MKRELLALSLLIIGLLAAGPAFAQEEEDTGPETRPDVPRGMGFIVGGGFSDFVNENARDFTGAGGGFDARYVLGTRSHIAGEAAYIGTLNTLDTLGVDEDALLLSNGLEGALRVNLSTMAWQPYVTAGIGWKRYNVTNTDTNTSDLSGTDDAMIVPIGVGLSYRVSRVIADVRGSYKPSFFDEISATDTAARLDTISATLNIGFEF
jgi:hypothetical protein